MPGEIFDPVEMEWRKKIEAMKRKRFEKDTESLLRKIEEIEAITLKPQTELRRELESLKSDPEKYAKIPIVSSGSKKTVFVAPEEYQEEFRTLNGL